MNRFALGFKSFWLALTNPEGAARIEQALVPAPGGPDLRILAVLQRDGRLVDFLQEDIDGYSDAQVGAAVRDIHRGCRKALKDYLAIEPILAQAEGDSVTLAPGFDPGEVRLTGNVAGLAPYRGVLKHHGWKVRSVMLPALPGVRGDSSVLAPAEVELS